ncbi:hypothetical protein C0J52_05920 [Blattella germanica]|nr:hypothetical protein C0J52_05920 [Blattella germanica]
MAGAQYQVTSEIHQAIRKDDLAKPSLSDENVVTKFSFTCPFNNEHVESNGFLIDEDGDLIVKRKENKLQKEEIILLDIDIGGILELIKANAARNSKLIKANFIVLGLDFFAKEWSPNLESKLTNVTVVLVADGERLLNTPPAKTIYIALEKRYVFTVADLDSVAPCYEFFLQCLQKARSRPPGSLWRVEQLPIDFPQYFNYERVKELVLWSISS